jgi:hypothetical protein
MNAVAVEVGGARLMAESASSDLLLELPGPQRLFGCPPEHPDLLATVARADLAVPPSGRLLFRSGGPWELREDGDGYLFRFTTPAFGETPYRTARFDRDLRHGRIELHSGYADRLPPERAVSPFEYPLDELFMMHWLTQGRGIELHACGLIEENGQGYLLVGHSGAGKTTSAQLWLEDRPAVVVLSDDRIILRFQQGKPWIYGTPWHGEAQLAAPRSAPLTAIFLLQKAERPGLVPLPAPLAVSRLFACSFVPFHSAEAIGFALELLETVVSQVPCAELRFRRDRSFLELVLKSG